MCIPFYSRKTVILMYHSISDRADKKSHPYYQTVTSPGRFAEQMQWLDEANAEVIALEQWNEPFTNDSRLRAIITFDDGFADFLTDAFPVLRQHGYTATMFLPTAFIGTGKELLPGVRHLNWDEVRQLSLAGISFGSHTVSHRHLDKISLADIHEEVKQSAETIAAQIGMKVTGFSCPFAFPQAYKGIIGALRESLRDCGYTVGVTTKIGTVSAHDDPCTLKRLPVNSADDKRLFMAKLHGGYNWLGFIQHWAQLVKKAILW
jgi:peptidoglycan/xylan/chitin deacetylase (PgdA/CDA1 family)